MTGNDVRRELAALRVRIAELEATVQRMARLLSSEAGARVMRQEERREREMSKRAAAICFLATQVGSGCIEAVAGSVETMFKSVEPQDAQVAAALASLRLVYGNAGPSRRTIRRALTELPNRCVNVAAAENEAITPPKQHQRTNDGRPIPKQARNQYP